LQRVPSAEPMVCHTPWFQHRLCTTAPLRMLTAAALSLPLGLNCAVGVCFCACNRADAQGHADLCLDGLGVNTAHRCMRQQPGMGPGAPAVTCCNCSSHLGWQQ
jgi:hypothetical protein